MFCLSYLFKGSTHLAAVPAFSLDSQAAAAAAAAATAAAAPWEPLFVYVRIKLGQ